MKYTGGFKQFADKVNAKYNEMSKNETLYRVNVSKDDLWNLYLGSYTGEEAKIFRERPVHDCQTCKSFINRLGNVVSITENDTIDSIWNVQGLTGQYKTVAENMHNLVVSGDISSIFYISETLAGKEYNIESTEKGDIRWEHFYADIDSKFVKLDLGPINSENESTVSVFNRALNEFSTSTLETVIDLCSSIYKGEEFLPVVSKFKDAKVKFDSLSTKNKKIFIWKEFKNYPSKIRNTAIGSLIIDIEEGKDLENAVKSYEAKVAPQNYKRTSAVVTPNMIKDAMKTINELGIEQSLYRRFAKLDDVSVNNVLFANRSAKNKMKDSTIESILMDTVQKKVNTTNITEIKIEDFISSILPKATNIEILPENKHLNNLCSIIAPVHPDAPNILKWDNNYSWAYKGGFTDSIKENVKNAGGKVEGLLRFSIEWNADNSNENDLDAHCISPLSHIYYGSKRGRCGGELDIDIINPNRKVAVENIIYQELPPKGKYEFKVDNFTDRGGSNFKAQIEFNNQIFNYSINGRISKGYPIATVTHDGNGNFTIQHHTSCEEQSKTIDGVVSKDFNNVSAFMLSPNYWNDNKIGNKHYMFLIEDAKNDDKIRGLYNEFLSEDLMKHRKVFDTLGSKLLCEESSEQLTGLGFSSTVRNDVVVRVTDNNSKRLYKIIF